MFVSVGRLRRFSLVFSCVLALILFLPAGAQFAQAQDATSPAPIPLPSPEERTGQPSLPEHMEKQRENAINKERQQDLKRDTDKLFKLAQELKQYVDNTNENVLSIQVIHKAEEIEKLAKSVKDKMKG